MWLLTIVREKIEVYFVHCWWKYFYYCWSQPSLINGQSDCPVFASIVKLFVKIYSQLAWLPGPPHATWSKIFDIKQQKIISQFNRTAWADLVSVVAGRWWSVMVTRLHCPDQDQYVALFTAAPAVNNKLFMLLVTVWWRNSTSHFWLRQQPLKSQR